jgi:hypothetical protein
MSDDIIDAIARFRVAFLREDFKPPVAIMLASHDEGMRLISYLNGPLAKHTYVLGDRTLGRPVEMADGSVVMEIEIMGMKVRWPANKYALPDGSWKFA